MTFTLTNSNDEIIELIPNGSSIPVTIDSRLRYCDLAIEYRLQEFDDACEAIEEGLTQLIPSRALKLLNWDQLELLVCGNPTVDLEILKSKTEYHNWPGGANHPTVKMFWKVLESFSDVYRSLFIRFVWGRSRLPPLKIWKRTFKLVRKEGSLDNLPVAHTYIFIDY